MTEQRIRDRNRTGLIVGKSWSIGALVDFGCAGFSVTGVPSHDAEMGKESKRHEL